MRRRWFARLGHWLVDRYDPPPSPIPVTRFRVVSTWFDADDNGGQARRMLEARRRQRIPGERLELYDGADCRGRYPE